jgi:anti-anti-sigma factor
VRDPSEGIAPEGLAVHVDGPEAGVVTIELVGHLDIETTDRFDQGIREAVARRPARVVVDFRQASYLDSSGVRALILAQREAGVRDVEMCLVPGSSHVRRILRTTGVAERFRLLDDPGRARS